MNFLCKRSKIDWIIVEGKKIQTRLEIRCFNKKNEIANNLILIIFVQCWHALLQSHILSWILWDIALNYATSTDIFQYYQIFENFVKCCHVLSDVVSCYLATKQSFHHFPSYTLNPKTSFTKVAQFGMLFESTV